MSDQQKVDRWGGPGASHENRDKPRPDPTVKDRDDPDHEGALRSPAAAASATSISATRRKASTPGRPAMARSAITN